MSDFDCTQPLCPKLKAARKRPARIAAETSTNVAKLSGLCSMTAPNVTGKALKPITAESDRAAHLKFVIGVYLKSWT